MMDWNTYFTTQNTTGGPIIRQIPPESYDYGDDVDELSTGVLIGRAIGLALIAGTLLYFYLIR